MCSLVQCFNVFVQPKHQELRTIIDVCGCAMHGCDGMSFDALLGMFRTLCSRSIVVRSFFTNSKHLLLFCQKNIRLGPARRESRIIGPFPWDAGMVIPSRRVFGWEKNEEKRAKDLREVRRGRLEEDRQEKDHRESETEGPVEQRRDMREGEKKEEEERATSLPRSTHVAYNTRSFRILPCRLYLPSGRGAVPK